MTSKSSKAMGHESRISTKFRWRITGFTTLTEREYFSDIFDVVGTKWRISLFPKGNKTDHLSIFLYVAESDTLPSGWKREVQFILTVVNQQHKNLSITTKETEKTFTLQSNNCGFTFISLRELQGNSGGFLVNNTLVVEAEVEVKSIHPPTDRVDTLRVGATAAATSTNRFDTYFASFLGLICGTSLVRKYESVGKENVANSESPSLEKVEQAKQSLKDCLTDLFKLNMKERLAKALLTLSLCKDGLSPDQQKAVTSFRENFDQFTSDFLTFNKENSEYELQKHLKDEMVRSMEKNHNTHLSFKQSHGELFKEGEELNMRLGDVSSKITKLMAEWDSLLAESKTLESNYKGQERKVADAEEKKRIAEERMSRSTAAWANLKEQFGSYSSDRRCQHSTSLFAVLQVLQVTLLLCLIFLVMT